MKCDQSNVMSNVGYLEHLYQLYGKYFISRWIGFAVNKDLGVSSPAVNETQFNSCLMGSVDLGHGSLSNHSNYKDAGLR